uniref:Endonuclease/exonuclease/phosphatase domain-containing protein n=1 Tax=Triticum urartu TaxID=4572 RepID=A0A8R7V1H3_TRIUA
MDAYVKLGPDDAMWRLTCVYGEPRVEDRHNIWTMLNNMSTQSDLPWLVVGDFNECMWDF